jgi:hypothetical protein
MLDFTRRWMNVDGCLHLKVKVEKTDFENKLVLKCLEVEKCGKKQALLVHFNPETFWLLTIFFDESSFALISSNSELEFEVSLINPELSFKFG